LWRKYFFLNFLKYGKMIRGKWRHVRGKQLTLHFKRCGLKKYGKMKCLMRSMSGIELCHALTIVFYNANSHLVVCRLKWMEFWIYSQNLFLLSILQHVIASKGNHINTMLPNEMVLAPLQKLKIKYELSYQSTTRLKYIDKFDQ
jgi:hypothetical protein